MSPLVLIVEDNTETASAVEAMLGMEGYRVATACDGLDALEYLKGPHPPVSLILLDLGMPRLDGYAFLEVMARDPDLRNIRVIIFSAVDPRQRLPEGVPYIRKGGADTDALLRAVERVCGGRAS